MFIKNDYQLTKSEAYMLKLPALFLAEDLRGITAIEKDCLALSSDSNDTFSHLSLLCNIYRSRITNTPFNLEVVRHLKKYLTAVDTWTHYEIVLFNNCMFIFDLDFIESVLPRATRGLDRYYPIRNYTSESLAMLSNVLTLYLSSKELYKANELFKKMTARELPEDLVRERLHLAFYSALIALIIHHETGGHEKIQQVLKTCEFLGMNNSYNGYSKFYTQMCQLYCLENV